MSWMLILQIISCSKASRLFRYKLILSNVPTATCYHMKSNNKKKMQCKVLDISMAFERWHEWIQWGIFPQIPYYNMYMHLTQNTYLQLISAVGSASLVSSSFDIWLEWAYIVFAHCSRSAQIQCSLNLLCRVYNNLFDSQILF